MIKTDKIFSLLLVQLKVVVVTYLIFAEINLVQYVCFFQLIWSLISFIMNESKVVSGAHEKPIKCFQ